MTNLYNFATIKLEFLTNFGVESPPSAVVEPMFFISGLIKQKLLKFVKSIEITFFYQQTTSLQYI